MKITGIKLTKLYVQASNARRGEERSVGPLDIYESYAQNPTRPSIAFSGETRDGLQSGVFLEITTDEGFTGIHGPIEYRPQLLSAVDVIAPLIVGKNPLENRYIWDLMLRSDRHSRAGMSLMAISAVDIALWDLKGKILGQPVWRLLGGGRSTIRPYISMLGYSVEPQKAVKYALEFRDRGFGGQKWFFRYGPADGVEGIRKNLALAFALRDALGSDYDLMFDCWMGWTVLYAKTIFRELAAVRPLWVEEVLQPHMADAYAKLKADTDIPLSAGEHAYTRMELNQHLKNGVFDVIQADPEWCGGITELLRVADLCEIYGVPLIPHGHSLMAALQVNAASSPGVCPYAEYLDIFLGQKMNFFAVSDRMGTDGLLHLNSEPGVGANPAYDRVVKSEEVKCFQF